MNSERFVGDRLHEKSRSWLSPPNPSENQVIARRDNHEGSAVWFTRGSTFEKWNADGCLLWIHGKRTSFDSFLSRQLMVTCHCSGIGEEHYVVCTTSVYLIQLYSY